MSLDSMSITHTVQAYMGDHMSRLLPVGRQLFQELTTQPESVSIALGNVVSKQK